MTCLNHDHRRILLIDQDPTKQNLRATILRNYEIEVHTASSLADAASLWIRHLYDLVLLAAPENSEEAAEVSAQLRRIRPRQRIGLLVGPPLFIREMGGARGAAKRRKVASASRISRNPAPENIGEAVSEPHPAVQQSAAPQWQEMIRRLVRDWYVGPSVLWGLSKLTDGAADA